MIKIGIIGIGRIVVSGYIPAIKELADVYVINAICNQKRIEEGKKVADSIGANHYLCVDNMLEFENLDAVIVASYAISHLEIVKKCIDYGLAVLVEKPLAVSLSACKEYDADFLHSNLFVSFQRRFHPFVIMTRKILQNSQLGTIKQIICTNIHSRNTEYYNKKERGLFDGGGVLFNQSIHSVDLLYFLFGDFSNVHYADMRKDHFDISVEDTFSAVFAMQNGAIVNFIATTGSYVEFGYELVIVGTDGTIRLTPQSIVIKNKNDEKQSVMSENGDNRLYKLIEKQMVDFSNIIEANNDKKEESFLCGYSEWLRIHKIIVQLYNKGNKNDDFIVYVS